MPLQLNFRRYTDAASTGEKAFTDLKSVVTEAARSYLVASDDDVEQRTATLHLLCAALGRLLGEHLAATAEWSRWHWVDGVEPETAVIISPTECEIWGVATWEGDSAQWEEPFVASVRLSGDRLGLAGYTLRFGDAATGLGETSVGARRRQLVRDAAPEWLYTFESRAV